jgi:hypothetical protein
MQACSVLKFHYGEDQKTEDDVGCLAGIAD